jgi:ligand-binding sensor domain-containing protein/signal transduction histidine kinase
LGIATIAATQWVGGDSLDRTGTGGRVVLGEDRNMAVTSWPSRFVRTVYTTKDWLPDNAIRTLLQTRDGYLWAGTRSGLARFDGREFRVHRDFPRESCTALAEDGQGQLWVGTASGGLVRLSAQGAVRLTRADGLADDRVLSLCAALSGDLWVGTMNGLNRLHRGRWEAIVLTEPDPHSASDVQLAVHAIHEDASGGIWLSRSQGVSRLSPANDLQEEFVIPPGTLATPALISGQPGGETWVLADWAVSVWDNGRIQPRPGGPETMKHPGQGFLADRAGNRWMGGDNTGLYRVDPEGRLFRFGVAEGLSDLWITCLLEDREGNLWIGTERGGLNRWTPAPVQMLTVEDGLPHPNVWTVATCPIDPDRVWIGTDDGLAVCQGGVIRPVTLPKPLFSPNVRALHPDRLGRLWIGTGDSLECLTADQLVTHRWQAAPAANKIRAILCDQAGNLWAGREFGLMLRQGDRWHHLGSADGLPHVDVRVLREDRDGSVWAGTFGGGLAHIRLTPGSPAAGSLPPGVEAPRIAIETLELPGGPGANFVWSLHIDTDGVLWAGTRRGLVRLAPRRFAAGPAGLASGGSLHQFEMRLFTAEDGLFDEVINEVIEDDFGRLWFGADRGIYSVAKTDLDALRSGAIERLRCKVFDVADGLVVNETNGQKSQPAACRTPDGRLWFPTPRGVAVIDPTAVEEKPPPPPVIQRLVLNGKVAFDDQAWPFSGFRDTSNGSDRHLHLSVPPASHRSLEVAYSAVALHARERLRFRYRLEGVDSDWVDAGDRETVNYENLRPGHYRFSVRTVQWFGGVASAATTLGVTLEPSLLEQRWFQVLAASLACGAVFAAWRGRSRQKDRVHQFHRQSELIRQREWIAQDLHDALGSSLTRLRSMSRQLRDRVHEGPVREGLDRLSTEVDHLLGRMRVFLDGTDGQDRVLADLLAEIREHAATLLDEAGMCPRWDFPTHTENMLLDARTCRAAILVIWEALANVVRHAHASEVRVAARVLTRTGNRLAWLELAVADNGCGLPVRDPGDALDDPQEKRGKRRGLEGMRSRIRAFGGEFKTLSSPGKGTSIVFRLPISRRLH